MQKSNPLRIADETFLPHIFKISETYSQILIPFVSFWMNQTTLSISLVYLKTRIKASTLSQILVFLVITLLLSKPYLGREGLGSTQLIFALWGLKPRFR